MRILNDHASDEDLVLMADGELSGRRASRVRAHLTACWECRSRMARIDATVVDFIETHRQTLDAHLPPAAGPRALLRARLAEVAGESNGESRRSPARWLRGLVMVGALAVLAAATLLVFNFAGGSRQRTASSPQASSAPGPLEPLKLGTAPDPELTPGAVRMVSIDDVCSMAHEEVVRQVSSTLRKKVFQEYGIVNARPADYEIDYLIAPGLGGKEDIHNLWPQPYGTEIWNADVKDSLEEHLHQMVCAGKLDLSTAQREIATDWIATYKKYFHTDRPLTRLREG